MEEKFFGVLKILNYYSIGFLKSLFELTIIFTKTKFVK